MSSLLYRWGLWAYRRPWAVIGVWLLVTAAAVIMTSVFAGFIVNPEPMIAQFGFALAAGILIDAFLVRMTLVPAVMAIAGDRALWLDRLLPELDIEGDRFNRRLLV